MAASAAPALDGKSPVISQSNMTANRCIDGAIFGENPCLNGTFLPYMAPPLQGLQG